MAFVVVSNVPRDYYKAIQGPLKYKMEKISYELPIENKESQSKDLSWKIFGKFLVAMIFLYEVVYFHFMPYFSFVIRFFAAIVK